MESNALSGNRVGGKSGNAYDVRMSHDLFVSIEAASSGETKSGGAGMSVEWGIAESPFGLCTIGWNSRGVCHLAFHDQDPGFPGRLGDNWPNAEFRRNDRGAIKWSREMFTKKTAGRIPAFVRGTTFQLKVWRSLLRIPPGSVATYSRIAAAIGNPGASRAVGAACGANPVAWLIPCHRVVRATGGPGGYRWGADRKKAMLAAEAAQAEKKRSRDIRGSALMG